jgi:hypothetical protein
MKHTHSEFVGIETNNHLNLGVTIYPNPTNGEVFIVTEHFNSSSMVNVFDAMGKLIVNQNLVSSTSKIDLSDYEKGIYFIQVTTAENTFNKKVIVE